MIFYLWTNNPHNIANLTKVVNRRGQHKDSRWHEFFEREVNSKRFCYLYLFGELLKKYQIIMKNHRSLLIYPLMNFPHILQWEKKYLGNDRNEPIFPYIPSEVENNPLNSVLFLEGNYYILWFQRVFEVLYRRTYILAKFQKI